jgi:hypothetical protein
MGNLLNMLAGATALLFFLSLLTLSGSKGDALRRFWSTSGAAVFGIATVLLLFYGR